MLHLGGAMALLLSLALLCQNRVGPAACLCAVQAGLVALAAGTSGILAGAVLLALAAVIGFTLNGIVLPVVLCRLVASPYAISTQRRSAVALLTAAAIVATCVAVATRLDAGPQGETIALALSIVLLGVLATPVAPAFGLLASQNGMLLAVAAAPDISPVVLLLAAVPLVPGLVAVGMWLDQRRRAEATTP